MVKRARMWRMVVWASVVGASIQAGSVASSAQVAGRPNAPRRPLAQQGATPGEIQQLFDAMVLMRAQEALRLSDEQYPRFLTRLKALQETRRRTENERMRILQELRRMVEAADPKLDDGIRDRLGALDAGDVRASADVRKAREGVDEVLELRQRAMFRLLEEQIERQKVELLMRARQANRPQNRF